LIKEPKLRKKYIAPILNIIVVPFVHVTLIYLIRHLDNITHGEKVKNNIGLFFRKFVVQTETL
jgi:hypothetical protein